MCSVKLDAEHVMGNMVFLCIMYAQKCYIVNTLGLQENKFINPPCHRVSFNICHFLWLLNPRRPWKL